MNLFAVAQRCRTPASQPGGPAVGALSHWACAPQAVPWIERMLGQRRTSEIEGGGTNNRSRTAPQVPEEPALTPDRNEDVIGLGRPLPIGPQARAVNRDRRAGLWRTGSSPLAPRLRGCTVGGDTECGPAPCWTLPLASAPSRGALLRTLVAQQVSASPTRELATVVFHEPGYRGVSTTPHMSDILCPMIFVRGRMSSPGPTKTDAIAPAAGGACDRSIRRVCE